MNIAPPLASLPDLWSAARRFCDTLVRKFGGPRAIPLKPSRVLRADIHDWLEPVEKLVRSLIITEACIYLLMTPEGRRLRETAKTEDWPACTPVQPPAPVAKAEESAAKEDASGQENRATPTTQPAAARTPADDWPTDPAAVDAPFEVLAWTPGGGQVFASKARNADGALPPPPSGGGGGERSETEGVVAPAAPRQPAYRARMHRTARRLEALLRAIANPQPYIEKTAAWLARLPDGALTQEHPIRVINALRWPHATRELAEATWHNAAAIRAWISAHAQWLRTRAAPDTS